MSNREDHRQAMKPKNNPVTFLNIPSCFIAKQFSGSLCHVFATQCIWKILKKVRGICLGLLIRKMFFLWKSPFELSCSSFEQSFDCSQFSKTKQKQTNIKHGSGDPEAVYFWQMVRLYVCVHVTECVCMHVCVCMHCVCVVVGMCACMHCVSRKVLIPPHEHQIPKSKKKLCII